MRSGRIVVAAGLSALILQQLTVGEAFAARPLFELPFACGERWQGATYVGHSGGSGYYPLDLNQGAGRADFRKTVVASASGTARLRTDPDGDQIVELVHGGGWTSEYRHLDEFLASNGQAVLAGQPIGRVGDRGTNSPHLHYEQQLNNVAQHIFLHGQQITYSFTYNGPTYTSQNCGTPPPPPPPPPPPKTDLLARNNITGDFYVAASQGSRFIPAANVWASNWGVGNYTFLTGDVTGDGLDDIIAKDNTNGKWYVARSTGGSFDASGGLWLDGWAPGGAYELRVADYNGDGKDDLLAVLNGVWYVATSTGNSFEPAATPWMSDWGVGNYTYLTGDVNGDGADDVIAKDNISGKWFVARSTGYWFNANSGFWLDGWASGNAYELRVADFNTDGKDDLLAVLDGVWYVATSNGSWFTPAATPWISGWGAGNYTRLTGEVNGDGGSDVIAKDNTSGKWFVARSTGYWFNGNDGFWLDNWAQGNYMLFTGNFAP